MGDPLRYLEQQVGKAIRGECVCDLNEAFGGVRVEIARLRAANAADFRRGWEAGRDAAVSFLDQRATACAIAIPAPKGKWEAQRLSNAARAIAALAPPEDASE
jgi:hypothetical protein